MHSGDKCRRPITINNFRCSQKGNHIKENQNLTANICGLASSNEEALR